MRRECRLGEDLGHQVEGRREAFDGDLDPDRHRVPACLRMERGAEALGGLHELDRRAALRALGKRPGHQRRDAGLRLVLVGGAARQDEGRRDELPTRQVDLDDAKPVVQLDPVEVGEVERTRLPRRRALGDDRRGAGFAAHAATSVSPLAATGTYVRTSRLSGRNTSAQTRWMSSVVTAR